MTVVIGVDSSERSADAIAFGARLAESADGDVIVASAFPQDGEHGFAGPRDAALDTAFAMSRRLAGVPAHRVAIRAPAGPPAEALHELAVAEGASLIVIGSTHTGRIGRVLPGSTGERLLRGAPCPVAVVPRGYDARPVGRIGVAYDGSPESGAALAAAVGLARTFDAALELIGVTAPDMYTGLRHRRTEQQLATAAAALPVIATTAVFAGDPAVELADRSAGLDVLVTGSRGFTPLRSVVTGGVSGRLLRSAQCPVVAVPR